MLLGSQVIMLKHHIMPYTALTSLPFYIGHLPAVFFTQNTYDIWNSFQWAYYFSPFFIIRFFNHYVPLYFTSSQELDFYSFLFKNKTCRFTNFPLHAVLATSHRFWNLPVSKESTFIFKYSRFFLFICNTNEF